MKGARGLNAAGSGCFQRDRPEDSSEENGREDREAVAHAERGCTREPEHRLHDVHGFDRRTARDQRLDYGAVVFVAVAREEFALDIVPQRLRVDHDTFRVEQQRFDA